MTERLIRCNVCGGTHEDLFVHCTKCGVLVSKTDVPPKAKGRCWRCEIEELRGKIRILEGRC